MAKQRRPSLSPPIMRQAGSLEVRTGDCRQEQWQHRCALAVMHSRSEVGQGRALVQELLQLAPTRQCHVGGSRLLQVFAGLLDELAQLDLEARLLSNGRVRTAGTARAISDLWPCFSRYRASIGAAEREVACLRAILVGQDAALAALRRLSKRLRRLHTAAIILHRLFLPAPHLVQGETAGRALVLTPGRPARARQRRRCHNGKLLVGRRTVRWTYEWSFRRVPARRWWRFIAPAMSAYGAVKGRIARDSPPGRSSFGTAPGAGVSGS
jgi:hypothetical protein